MRPALSRSLPTTPTVLNHDLITTDISSTIASFLLPNVSDASDYSKTETQPPRKRKRSETPPQAVTVSLTAESGQYPRMSVPHEDTIVAVQTHTDWILLQGQNRIYTIQGDASPLDLAYWPPIASGTGLIGSRTLIAAAAFRRSRRYLDVIVTYGPASGPNIDVAILPITYHIVFSPRPALQHTIQHSSEPIACNGVWVAFLQKHGTRRLHLYRLLDGYQVDVKVDEQVPTIGFIFAPTSRSAITYSSRSELLNVFDMGSVLQPARRIQHHAHQESALNPKFDMHLSYIPSQVKAVVEELRDPLLLMRHNQHIEIIQITPGPRKTPSLPSCRAVVPVGTNHYLGDFCCLPGINKIAILLHDRTGKEPTLLQVGTIPEVSVKVSSDDTIQPLVPEIEDLVTVLRTDPQESNILRHCNILVPLPTQDPSHCKLLIGQRKSTLWFHLNFPLPIIKRKEDDAIRAEGSLVHLPRIGATPLSELIDEIRRKLRTDFILEYSIMDNFKPELDGDGEDDDWDLGSDLHGYTSELSAWPGGALVALKVCYGFTEPIQLLAARSEGESTFLFRATTNSTSRYFALQVNYEYRTACHRFRLRRSDTSPQEAYDRLLEAQQPERDPSPHPDWFDQLLAIEDDLEFLERSTAEELQPRRDAIMRRLSGMFPQAT
ncbi:hypothetical protein CALCODRAFT_509370 [Calocera cornea HHB12733]|uniref:Uncharacterized protein n=1 Tax=Calocera cornea HHB12733 TaxID=1353952 RepID=A0A165FDR4_9BASI|nr:hypothetical protein CALCODRAFT_509370 [Calocera cornea HHB12733]